MCGLRSRFYFVNIVVFSFSSINNKLKDFMVFDSFHCRALYELRNQLDAI